MNLVYPGFKGQGSPEYKVGRLHKGCAPSILLQIIAPGRSGGRIHK